jgi:hypothetical protein
MSEASKIYIDLDALLDVRQSVLIEIMGQERALDLVTSDAYNFRDVDVFEVDMALFTERLQSGDKTLLKNARITYMEVALKSKINNIGKRNAFNNASDRAHVLVNVHPYLLTEQEARAVQNAVFLRLDRACEVTIVREPTSNWTPSNIRSCGIYAYYGYDFGKWMDVHSDHLETTDLRETQMYFAPMGKKVLTKEELKVITKLGFKDPFGYMEFLLSSVTKLTFLPCVFYSNVLTASGYLQKYHKTTVNEPLI